MADIPSVHAAQQVCLWLLWRVESGVAFAPAGAHASSAPAQSTLGPTECKAALEDALRQPSIARVLAKLRDVHKLSVNPTVCDPSEHLRSPVRRTPRAKDAVRCTMRMRSGLHQ